MLTRRKALLKKLSQKVLRGIYQNLLGLHYLLERKLLQTKLRQKEIERVNSLYLNLRASNKRLKDTDKIMAKSKVSLSVGRGEKLPISKGAGLTAKGRAKYNRATGSNLKAPAPNPKTEKDAARRKSFCARMSGMKGATSKDGELTRKGAALKRWKC
jgi:hypothetical protein